MDILYIVGTGSKWDNNELKYSLRSLEKNGTGINRVMIVGEKPKFVIDDMPYMYCFDKYGKFFAHKNIYNKIKIAIHSGMLPDHFLISSDDHFYYRPTDFDNYPVYYREREIPAEIPANVKHNLYQLSLQETRKFLLKHGLPVYQTNPHANTHIDVNLWKDNLDLFTKAQELRWGGETNCIMGNLMIANGIIPEPIEDCKVYSFEDRAEFDEKIKNVHVFSMADKALNCGIGSILSEMFPEKSRWEK